MSRDPITRMDDAILDLVAEALCPEVRKARALGEDPPEVQHGHHSDARRLLEHPRFASILAAGMAAEAP